MNTPQQGMALIESLVAATVLGIGLLGATQLTLKALETANDTRQRGVARLLALEAMDCAMSRSPCPQQVIAEVNGLRYERLMRITPGSNGLHEIEVTVQWTSPAGAGARGALARLVWHSSVSSLPDWVSR